jgi:L-ribulose-5-phosphate 4-epimerase
MLKELKRESYEANMLLPEWNLVDLTFGNVSALSRQRGILAIKPSGVPYEDLKPEDMVLVDLEGKKVEGKLNPSSDTPTHACLYRAFESIAGIVHTHARYATSFAQAGLEIPCYGTTHADHFYGPVPLTRKLTAEEINRAYEVETGNVIVERFKDLDPVALPGVLVMSHAPFTWGPSALKAVEYAYALEIMAQMAIQTRLLNPAIKPVDQYLLDKHYLRKHGKNAYYGQK